MNKEIFAKELSGLKPSMEDFKGLNVSKSFIEEEVARYHCEPRSKNKLKIVTNDEILNLLQSYDCSAVGIGNLSFLKEIVERVDYYEIGRVEIDVLVVNKITLEVEVRDYAALSHVIWPCASRSDFFLEALLECAKFLRTLLKTPSDDTENLRSTVANDCAQRAGGDRYIDFYKMLLGCFD